MQSQYSVRIQTSQMNRNTIRKCAKIFIFLTFIISKGLSQQFEKTTSCVYRSSVDGVQSFEFICSPNENTREFFTDGSPISCKSDKGSSFYKERRHEIRFRDCYFRQLPVIFMWYKAVRQLNVSSLGLETLRSKNFDYAVNLLTLIASHNQLTEIPSSLFDDAKSISDVDFSFNKINRIDLYAFNTGNHITSLNLSNNLIVEIDNQTFSKLTRLEVLNLNGNLISDIPVGLFDELILLRSLNLASNEIKRLKCSIFANSINLGILNLSHNRLQIFDSNCVRSAKTLALFLEGNELNNLTLSGNVGQLNASANNITQIFIEGGLNNMTSLNISKNRVENVPEMIKQLTSQLRTLDVSDSAIGKLNINTFEKFDNLEDLFLRNTNLSNIQYGTFHHQQRLSRMDVSKNDLKKINFGMLHWNSVQLKMLHLDGNQLEDLSNLTKANYPSLEHVSIGANNFDCDYLSEIQQRWNREGISVVLNPHEVWDVPNTNTHINGITCYHNSVASELPIVDNELKTYPTSSVSSTDSISMWKIEAILIGIVVLLVCLLAVTILKHLVPAFQSNRTEMRTEPVYYRPSIDEHSLI